MRKALQKKYLAHLLLRAKGGQLRAVESVRMRGGLLRNLLLWCSRDILIFLKHPQHPSR
jgi:hypothetical protein